MRTRRRWRLKTDAGMFALAWFCWWFILGLPFVAVSDDRPHHLFAVEPWATIGLVLWGLAAIPVVVALAVGLHLAAREAWRFGLPFERVEVEESAAGRLDVVSEARERWVRGEIEVEEFERLVGRALDQSAGEEDGMGTSSSRWG